MGEAGVRCQICGKIYRTLVNLKLHVAEVHLHARNHICNLCGAKFARKTLLNNHTRRRHGGALEFECTHCPRAYAIKADLDKHKKRKNHYWVLSLLFNLIILSNKFNSLWQPRCCHMATWNQVNIGSGNGLWADSTKPFSEPMLTYHRWGPLAFISGHYPQMMWRYQSIKRDWKLQF